MASQRSRKASPKRGAAPKTKPIPGWVWIFGTTAFLAFAGFLYYLASVPRSSTITQTEVRPASSSKPKPASDAAKPVATKPNTQKKQEDASRFKFYEMLPKTEVIPPKVEEYQPPESTKDLYSYLVQTGSFRSAAEAERQRALIGFQGLKASIEEVSSDNGQSWFRVQVGPFTSRSHMNKAVDKLVAINIQPLVRRNKIDNSKAAQ